MGMRKSLHVSLVVTVAARALPTAADATGAALCGADTAELLDIVVAHRVANLAWSTDANATEAELRMKSQADLQKSLDFCNSVPDAPGWFAFCDAFIGCSLLREWRSYRQGYDECSWEEDTDFELRFMENATDERYYAPVNQDRWSDLWPGLNRESGWGSFDHGKTRRKCSFETARGTWHVERVGPFFFQKPDEWTAVWWDPFNEFERASPDNEGRSFIGSNAVVSDPHGEVLALPPVHMHHFHLYQVGKLSGRPPFTHYQLSETHGDSGCTRSGLGGLCYLQVFPEGYGMQLPESFFADANVNTIFPAETAAGPIEFWFDAAVYFPHDKTESAIKPFGQQGINANDLFNPLQKTEAGTFRVPPTGEHASWHETTWRQGNSTIAWLHWHSHYFYQQDFMAFIDVTAAELGLDQPPYVMTVTECGDSPETWPYDSTPDDHDPDWPVRCKKTDSPMAQSERLGQLLELTSNGLSTSMLQTALLNNLDAHRKRTGRGSLLVQQGSPFEFHEEQLDGFWAAAKPFVAPLVTRVEDGQHIVSVGFYSPQWGVADVIRQHSALTMLAVPDKPLDAHQRHGLRDVTVMAPGSLEPNVV